MLTDEQQKVVDHEGNLLVIARAGSGKTYSLKERYLRLLADGVEASKILCVTFTNKAGKEMRERISKAANLEPASLSIYTFHGLCNHWLRTRGEEIGQGKYTIMSGSALKTVINNTVNTTILNKTGFKMFKSQCAVTMTSSEIEAEYMEMEADEKANKVRMVTTAINCMGNMTNPTPSKAADSYLKKTGSSTYSTAFIVQACTKYIQYKHAHSMLDFTDLITLGTKLFNKLDMRKEYEVMFVDELQDSGDTDRALMKALNIKNVVGVGDEVQGIYMFRGATSDNMCNFAKDFKADTLYLTKNFRSKPDIILLANAVMEPTKQKPMLSHHKGKGTIHLQNFATESDEHDFIVNKIKQLTKGN